MKKYLLIDDEEIFNFIQSEVIKLNESSDEIIMFSSAKEALDYIIDLINN